MPDDTIANILFVLTAIWIAVTVFLLWDERRKEKNNGR